MSIHKRDTLYSRPDLKARGWTDKLIRTFLLTVDDTRPNPFSKKAGEMSFWLRARVEDIETSPEWCLARGRAESRQISATQAIHTKTQKAVVVAKKLLEGLKIERLPMKQVSRQAFEFYSGRYEDFDGLSDKAMCSYIRHNLTNYDEILDSLKGKVGMGVLYNQVKLFLCTRIIREYGLEIDPVYAATGDSDENEVDLNHLEEFEASIFAALGTDKQFGCWASEAALP